MSEAGSVYEEPVAPAMLEHAGVQRCHWYVYEIGGVPDHAPVDTVSFWPTVTVPAITGKD